MTKYVLVADDQAGIRFLLDTIIRESGLEPVLAANGKEAVEKAKKYRPELIFLDIRMPVMDGVEALSKIKEEGIDACVVLMSAYTDESFLDRARNIGFSRFLRKPFDLNDVRTILKAV